MTTATRRLMTGVAAATIALAFAAKTAAAQDPLAVSPANHKLLMENDQVRVYEIIMKPGDKLATHSHPAHVVYFLASGKVRFATPDGRTTDAESKPGDVRWSDPVTHTVENIGTGDTRAIVVELKRR